MVKLSSHGTRKTPKKELSESTDKKTYGLERIKIDPMFTEKGPGDISLDANSRWAVIEAMLKELGLTRFHVHSFDRFIDEDLVSIIEQNSRVDAQVGVYVDFKVDGQVKIDTKPQVGEDLIFTPQECRWMEITYSIPLRVEFVVKKLRFQETPYGPETIEEDIKRDVIKLCDLPLIIGSRHDPYLNEYMRKDFAWMLSIGEDPTIPDGYAIINGSERVFLPREETVRGRIIVEELKGTSAVSSKFKVSAWITTPGIYRNRVSVYISRKDMQVVVRFPQVSPNKYVPLMVLVRALGLTIGDFIRLVVPEYFSEGKYHDIVQLLFLNIKMAPTEALKSQEEALKELFKYIQRVGLSRLIRVATDAQKIALVKDVLNRYFLSHLGTSEDSYYLKAYYLARIVRRAAMVYLGYAQADDRDHYKNKRLKMVGDFLRELFSFAWREFIRASRTALATRAADFEAGRFSHKDILKTEKISEVVNRSLATGTWPTRVTGVTETFGQLNQIEMISHLRRVKNILISRVQAKHGKPEARDLHPTQWGRICITTTSEGTMCGLTKQLALSAYVSVGLRKQEREQLIKEILPKIGLEAVEIKTGWFPVGLTPVFIDGVIVGVCRNPKDFVRRFREYRRKGIVPWEANIKYWEEWNEVHINADSGRILRPLIIVENGKPKLTKAHAKKLLEGEMKFTDLIKNGIIEMLDAEEEEDAYIAIWEKDLSPAHTHLEIAPAATLDLIPNLIPFADTNQAPKIIHETSMAKQALTIPRLNYRIRPETSTYLMYYPQRPIVTTRPLEFLGISERGFGQNAIVAVLSYEGFNIEDAIIINKAAIERGLFNGALIRIYEVLERTHTGGAKDEIKLPVEQRDIIKGKLETLAEDGLTWEGLSVQEGEEIVGRLTPIKGASLRAFRVKEETSEKVRPGEAGYIDSIVISSLGELGQKGIKVYVKLRQPRPVELGDKFASRSGQKGVVSLIIPQEDMPFTEDGIIPDIIFNPHGIPSRMTVGFILEALAGSIACKLGHPVDGTTFESENWMEYLIKKAKELGLNYYGEKTLYDGKTGRMYKAHILVGPMYYQRLKHLARDKIHVRSSGKYTLLTLQPPGGRAHGGGLRLGEMEKDALVGHGLSLFLRERFVDSSDGIEIFVCEEHGAIAHYDPRLKRWICPFCKEKTSSLARITVPYAFVLLIRELQSLGIKVQLKTSEMM